MYNYNQPDRVPLGEWLVQVLRLTAFPSPSAEIAQSTWWEEIVGEPPETRTTQRRSGVQRDEGQLEIGILTLEVQPLRIDWRLTPIEEPHPRLDRIPVLGPFPEAMDTFLGPMIRWLELSSTPALLRLAFGAVLILPVESHQAGYMQLSSYLPSVRLDPHGTSDFLYQINKPRAAQSRIPDLRINRLTKWSVVRALGSLLRISPEVVSQLPTGESFACRVEMDINSSPDFDGELPHDQLATLFQEFIDLGYEILAEGDIP